MIFEYTLRKTKQVTVWTEGLSIRLRSEELQNEIGDDHAFRS